MLWEEQHVQNFGDPFFLVIREGETLAEVKLRVQKKLQVTNEEFLKVNIVYVIELCVPVFMFSNMIQLSACWLIVYNGIVISSSFV